MEKQWKQWQTIFLGSKITADADCSHKLAPWKKRRHPKWPSAQLQVTPLESTYWTVLFLRWWFSKTSVCFTLFCCKKSTCFCNHSKYCLESEKWVTLPHWGRLYLCFWQLSWGEFHQVVDFSADLYHSGFRFCIPTWGLGIISLFVYQLGDQDHFLPLFFFFKKLL